MSFLLFVGLNELAALLTMAIVFPGMLDVEDGDDLFFVVLMMIPMSFIWWLYLAVSPIAFLIMYLKGDLEASYWTDAWPWRLVFGSARN